MRGKRVVGLSLGGSLLVLPGLDTGAGAIPKPDSQTGAAGGCAADTSILIDFDASMSAAEQDEVTQAAAEITSEVWHHAATDILVVRESIPGETGDVLVIDENLGVGNFGVARCGDDEIALNVTELGVDNDLEAAAAHELGHFIGLSHTGDETSYSQNPPTMATCISANTTDYRNKRTFSSDDRQAAVDNTAPSSLHNGGFENGETDWDEGADADLDVDTAIKHTGNASGKITVSGFSANSFVRQRLRYSNPNGADPRYALEYKANSNNVGTFEVEIWAAPISYGGSPGCDFVGGHDLNNRTSNGTVTRRDDRTFTPTNAFQFYESSADEWDMPSTWEGANMELRVYKETSEAIWIDDVRLYIL